MWFSLGFWDRRGMTRGTSQRGGGGVRGRPGKLGQVPQICDLQVEKVL